MNQNLVKFLIFFKINSKLLRPLGISVTKATYFMLIKNVTLNINTVRPRYTVLNKLSQYQLITVWGVPAIPDCLKIWMVNDETLIISSISFLFHLRLRSSFKVVVKFLYFKLLHQYRKILRVYLFISIFLTYKDKKSEMKM